MTDSECTGISSQELKAHEERVKAQRPPVPAPRPVDAKDVVAAVVGCAVMLALALS